MKIHFALVLCASLLPMACGQITSEEIQAAKDALSSMSSEDQAANDLYLDDLMDSAGEEAEEDSAPEADEEVKGDVKEERLKQMTAMLFQRLDVDKSGNLTLEEFLVGPEKRAEEKEVKEEVALKMKERLTADFEKHAGEDKLLTEAELQVLLKECAPRVGHHRHKHFPGKKEERVVKTSEELIKEFDKDADGKLDASELEALRNAKKSEIDKFREKKGKGPGHEHGDKSKGEGPRGPGGKDGDDKSDDDDKDDGKGEDDSSAPVSGV